MVGSAAAVTAAAASSEMYADSMCNSNLCLAAIYSPAEKMLNMTMSAQGGGAPMGWYAVGTGNVMAGSNMMIGWIDSTNNIMMSQRTTPSGHKDPQVAITAQAAVMDMAASTTNATTTVWKWAFPLSSTDPTPNKQTAFIWAVNKGNNPADASDAHLKQHKSYGTTFLDMTKPYTAANTGSTVDTPATSSSSSNSDSGADGEANDDEEPRALGMSNNLIIAHMVFMILAWLILVPAAILVARYGRLLFHWFPVHRNIQLAAFVSVLIAFILIVVEVGSGEHFDSDHAKAGLAIFVVLFVQMALGLVGHRTKRFHVSRIVHVVVGLGITVTAVWNVTSGLQLWDWGVPMWATYVVWAWGALLLVIYLVGLVFLRKDLRQHRELGEKDAGSGTHLAASSPNSELHNHA